MAEDNVVCLVDLALAVKRMLSLFDKASKEHSMMCSSLTDVEYFFRYPNIELDFLDDRDD